MQQRLQVRRPRLQVAHPMRWLRSLVRQQELRCCLVEAARRRPLVLPRKGLGQQVGQRQHRRVRRVLPWSEAVDQLRRLEPLQLRWLALLVPVHRRHRRRQARLPGRLWLLMVDRALRRPRQRVRLPRMQERLWNRQLRSRVRLLVLRWCTLEAASRRQ